MTEQELFELKDEINEAKKKKDKLEGQLEYLKKTLKEKWGVKNLKEANNKLKTLKEKVNSLNEKIKIGTQELENKYIYENN